MKKPNETIQEDLRLESSDEAHNRQVERFLMQRCNDGRCWVVRVIFGRLFATPFQSPSRIPHTCIDATWQFDRKYWRSGDWHEFPERARRLNEQAAYSGDR